MGWTTKRWSNLIEKITYFCTSKKEWWEKENSNYFKSYFSPKLKYWIEDESKRFWWRWAKKFIEIRPTLLGIIKNSIILKLSLNGINWTIWTIINRNISCTNQRIFFIKRYKKLEKQCRYFCGFFIVVGWCDRRSKQRSIKYEWIYWSFIMVKIIPNNNWINTKD